MTPMRNAFPAILSSLLVLVSASARAQSVPIDHETLTILGWNKNCSVALSHLSYPKVGYAIAEDPVRTRLGALTIAPGQERAASDLRIDWDGKFTWKPGEFGQARAALQAEGYDQQGWVETIRPDPVVDARDLPRLITSTDTLQTASTDFPRGFPNRWRLSEIRYSPLDAACGLLIFTDKTAPPGKSFYTYRLLRIGNPAVRKDRALAHVTNGLLLLGNGDRDGALAETSIAAVMAPDYATARYQRAAMLCLGGQEDAAVQELAAAVKLDPSYGVKARDDENFADMRWDPRFKDLTK